MYNKGNYNENGENQSMIFRKATQDDLDYVRENPFENAVKCYPYMQCPDENTYAVIYEESLVAVGGLYVRWEGVGLLWLMLTADSKKGGLHGLRALDAIKEKTDELIAKNNLWRAEALIRLDFKKAIKMIEFLGFEREATLEKYMPDKTDAYLYKRIL